MGDTFPPVSGILSDTGLNLKLLNKELDIHFIIGKLLAREREIAT